mmetsp:Transcript_16369/g.38965  ORF Transcript_16369/g.38965 Transcript_16369/m.38965 type:complete len:180 (+) Transcript_16369:20-559(+)
MPGKTKASDAENDALLALVHKNDRTFGGDQRLFCFGLSFVASLVPVFLYVNVFALEFEKWAQVYGVITLICAVILTFAHENHAVRIKLRIMDKRGVPVSDAFREQSEKHREKELRARETRESIGWESLFLALAENFARFFFLVVFLGVVVLRSAPRPVNYVVSLTTSAALLWYNTMRTG